MSAHALRRLRTCAMIKVGFQSWVGLGMLLLVTQLHAQVNQDWVTPIDPFRFTGNLYYVGSKDLASYLIVTPKRNILINSSLEAYVALIRHSVEKLGFRFRDIKVLLISHAHMGRISTCWQN